MIDNKLVSSKSVIAKIISDLDLKEDEIKITDIRNWIGEAMEKIGAVQQLEHKVEAIPVENMILRLTGKACIMLQDRLWYKQEKTAKVTKIM